MSTVIVEKTIYKNSSNKYYAELLCTTYVDNQGLINTTNIFGLRVMVNPDGKTEIQYFDGIETKAFKKREKLEKHILKILKKLKIM